MANWESLLALRRPWIVAHRGYSARYPENTMVAIDEAIRCGADVVALNVVLTADRVPVVLHDERVDRTTNGSGLVAYMMADAVTSLDAGSWFDPSFADQRVPTLDQVLDHVGDRVVISLELRSAAFEHEEREDTLEYLVLDSVRERGLEHAVVLCAFEPSYFARIERRDRSVPRMLLCDQEPCEMDAVSACERLGVMAFSPEAELIEQTDVLRVRAAGLKVVPWTVNSESEMRRFLGWGVDGLVTDEVERLGAVIASPHAAAEG